MHPAARRCSAPTSAPSRPWPTRVRHPPRALFPKTGTFTRRVPPLRVVVRDRLPRGLPYVRHGLGCPNGAHVSRARAPRAGWWPNLDLRWSVGGRSHMGPPRALPVLGLWSRFFVMSALHHDRLSRTTRGSVGEGLKATLYAQTLISWDFTLQVVISSRFWTCPQPVGTSPPGPRSTPGRASASAQVPPPASTRSPRRKARTHAHTRGPSFQMLTSSHHQIESPSVTPACTKMLPGHPLPDHRYRRDRLPETDTLTRLQVRCSSTSDFIHAFHGILTLQERWRLLP